MGRGIVGGREDRIKGRLVSRRIVVDGGRLRVVWELPGSKIGRGERLGDGWAVGIRLRERVEGRERERVGLEVGEEGEVRVTVRG